MTSSVVPNCTALCLCFVNVKNKGSVNIFVFPCAPLKHLSCAEVEWGESVSMFEEICGIDVRIGLFKGVLVTYK